MHGEIIERATEYIEQVFQGDFSGHDAHHTLRVWRMAAHLAAMEGAEPLIVELAALLHDVDDAKLSPETCEGKLNAVAFMRGCGLPEETISRVCTIIGEVSFRGDDSVTPTTLEGCCVQDADRLDAIGAVGIARVFAFGGSHGRAIYEPSQPPRGLMSQSEYTGGGYSTSINHFYEKLLLLKEMMTTDTARAVAEQRDAYMRAFLEEFYAEWEGER